MNAYQLRPSQGDPTRAGVCPVCAKGYEQTRVILREWDSAAEGWGERFAWVPSLCPSCERRKLRAMASEAGR